MELTDGTVTLRPPVDDDLAELANAIRSSQAELAPFMPWAAGPYDEADTLAWIRIDRSDEHSFLILDPDDAVVGACGLNQFDRTNLYANLGYWVRTSSSGRGSATRAARLVARYGFDELELARIEILMSVENAASRRVAERLGARHEGILRNRLLLHGRHHAAHVFSLVPSDRL